MAVQSETTSTNGKEASLTRSLSENQVLLVPFLLSTKTGRCSLYQNILTQQMDHIKEWSALERISKKAQTLRANSFSFTSQSLKW